MAQRPLTVAFPAHDVNLGELRAEDPATNGSKAAEGKAGRRTGGACARHTEPGKRPRRVAPSTSWSVGTTTGRFEQTWQHITRRNDIAGPPAGHHDPALDQPR